MYKIEHIGIAVEHINEANALMHKLLGKENYKEEFVESEQVLTSFFQMGESKIELLASENEEGVISKYIAKKGPGVHHIAFAVKDIYAEIERLKKEGFIFINETPKEGADNKWIVFLHPKSTNGILVELCQEREN